MKIIIYIISATLIVALSIVASFYLYTTVLAQKSLQEIAVNEHSVGSRYIVSLDGRLLGGVLAIKSIGQYQKGSCVVVVVKVGIARRGLRNSRFHIDVPLSDDVNEVSFGDPKDVVWKRKT